ncbi:hypothetical protein [Acinetobacter sp. ESBL14]|uniref:hypothetical protein n=1 Tax=Acinetobacter sp. ESBL14 TaxID=3077329 RepID=UPI002FC89C72
MQIQYKKYGGISDGELIVLDENSYRTNDGYVRVRDYIYLGGSKYMTEYFIFEGDLSSSREKAEKDFRRSFSPILI